MLTKHIDSVIGYIAHEGLGSEMKVLSTRRLVLSTRTSPIIAQNGTYTYNAAQVIGDYLKPLISHNDYIIKNTQDFPKMLKVQPPLAEDEEYVSYDVVSLFTNIPIHDTIITSSKRFM